MPWISRKKLAENDALIERLKVQALPYNGEIPYMVTHRVRNHDESQIMWPKDCGHVPVSRHVLERLVAEANAYRNEQDPA